MWLVKKDFPLPLGPSMNLLRFVVMPFFMGKSDMSMCSGRPLTPVHHFDTERRKRTLVVRFFHEQAESLPQERVETFLCRGEVRLVAGYARPKERGRVGGVVAWFALH